MSGIGTMSAFIALLGGFWAPTERPNAAAQDSRRGERGSITISIRDLPHPGPEMERVFQTFVGTWQVRETFEVSRSQEGKTREGTASYRAGPGYSLIEDYRSNGSAGMLHFFSILWWDTSAHVYRLLTCANNEGCQMRGTAKWEGKELVNSWEEKVDGKTAIFKDSFLDILPSSIRLVSEGTAGGKIIWHVTTKYERLPERNH